MPPKKKTAKPTLDGPPRKRRAEIAQPDPEEVLGPQPRPDLEVVCQRMADLKEDAKAFNQANRDEFLVLEARAIDIMDEDGTNYYEGEKLSAALVRAETPTVDWDGIQRELTTTSWEQVSTRVGDKSKLDAFIKDLQRRGGHDLLIKRILRHVTMKPSKPYVRVTPKKEKT